MGQRANLVIVHHQAYRLYYSHWCANTLPDDLFWGPSHAVKFIRMQREVDSSEWLDDVWAEGGAVLDRDRQVLLLFGGEDLRYDVPERRIYLQMLRKVWPRWEVRWAYEGIADLADYVEVPRTKVLTVAHDEAGDSLQPPGERDWTVCVGSFRLPDGSLRLYPLPDDASAYLCRGAGLSDRGRATEGLESLALDEWLGTGFPSSGFHVDVGAKKLDYWAAADIPGVPALVQTRWPDWTVTWHRDEFESQLERTGGALRFPQRSQEFLQDRICRSLLHERKTDNVQVVLHLTRKAREEGKDVDLNPWALRDDRLELDAAEKQRILQLALG